MPDPIKKLSVSELERLLTKRKSQLGKLTRRRTALERQLAAIDHKIGQLGGIAAGKSFSVRRKIRRRPRNAKSLTAVVVDVLKKNKAGLSLDKLASKVRATGYKSHSADFKNVVYQCLYNNRKTIARDENAGLYKLV